MLVNAVLTSPSMLIGREASVTQRPMAVVRPLDGGYGRSIHIMALPMYWVLTPWGICGDLMIHISVVELLPAILHVTLIWLLPFIRGVRPLLAVSARDGNADTQRPMVIGETIGWKAHATESSIQSMKCWSNLRAADFSYGSFKWALSLCVALRCVVLTSRHHELKK